MNARDPDTPASPPAAADKLPVERPAAAPPDSSAIIGRWMFAILIWGFALVGGSMAFEHWQNLREADRAPRVIAGNGGFDALELTADRRGHYVLQGEINGSAVEFLVDTGASTVALPLAVADRIGLRRGRETRVDTANGSTKAWRTTIDTLRLGPLSRTDVAALVTPGMRGETALLGMSFLRHFDLSQRDGRLMIRAPGTRR